MIRTMSNMNFSGDLITNNLYLHVVFQLTEEPDEEAEINLVWPITGGMAGVIVLGTVIYSVSKKKRRDPSSRDSKGENEPTTEFIL